jgi:hypothetical protein
LVELGAAICGLGALNDAVVGGINDDGAAETKLRAGGNITGFCKLWAELQPEGITIARTTFLPDVKSVHPVRNEVCFHLDRSNHNLTESDPMVN